MALSFVANTMTLSTWGFSAGDIAVLAGAGRAVGTWVMANIKDRSLLDFLNVDSKDILVRAGLVDTAMLHLRWDNQLTLFQNGKKITINPPGGSAVENMNSFTWFMTLVAAVLDASVSFRLLKKIMTEFVMKLFKDEEADGLEHLQRELSQHIEGWLSVACVRGILHRARQEWGDLGVNGLHYPGSIPESDYYEVVRLLMWIAAEKTQRFVTSSTDTFSVAVVLSVIGLDLLMTGTSGGDYDENQIVVTLSTTPISAYSLKAHVSQKRQDMRIPLGCMEEAVSVWPGTATENSERREIFAKGMSAAQGITFKLRFFYDSEEATAGLSGILPNHGLYYELKSKYPETTVRMKGNSQKLGKYFPLITDKTAEAIAQLASSWKSLNVPTNATIGIPMYKTTETRDEISGDIDFLGRLQTFVLGYYYALLRPLVDSSFLSDQEAFGAWSWCDYEILDLVEGLGNQTPALRGVSPAMSNTRNYWRYSIMKVIAYLFVGADVSQVSLLDHRTTGVLSKLSLVTASMIGDVDTPEKAAMFYILDIDASCIPSTARGIVASGQQAPTLRRIGPGVCSDIKEVNLPWRDTDFTSHIEPDYEYDTQTSLVVFRDKGRLVHRLSPTRCDVSIVTLDDGDSLRPETPSTASRMAEYNTMVSAAAMHVIPFHEFHGGYTLARPTLLPNEARGSFTIVLVVQTHGLPKARTCIRTMYDESTNSATGYQRSRPIIAYSIPPCMDGAQVLYDEEVRPIVLA
jgi:hypothetical protein